MLEADVRHLLRIRDRAQATAFITTEKDAVRFPLIDPLEVPIYYLRVEIEILNGLEVWLSSFGIPIL